MHDNLLLCGQGAQIKIRMTRVLRFWVHVEYQRIKKHVPRLTITQFLAQILGKREEAGDAMRHLNTKGQN